MNLIHLSNFIQVVEWGNISKAAQFLNIAQPALSRQILSLEEELGAKLLRRHTWGVEPTEDGKNFLECARRIQKECTAARESVQLKKGSPVGTAYLGVPSAYAVTLVPPLLQRMRVIYPNIRVHVVEAFSGTI
ncbi:MAG: LysR family transcriptional regulator, partial [Sphingomonadales bacterium]|nr:LysR family transcriptional regulator [Sphingomonadales bacterium]